MERINNHYSNFSEPTPDVLEKLRLSEEEAATIPTRFMRCPFCNFKVSKIPITQTEVVFVKCQKCKFQGALSPAYFRRSKRRKYGACYSRRRRMIR